MQPEQNNNPLPQIPQTDEITEMYAPDNAVEMIEPAEDVQMGPDDIDKPSQTAAAVEPVYWSANEYIHQEKNGLWYIIFAFVVIALIAADIFFIQSFFYTFSILVVVMAASIIVYARRPPRIIDYTLSGDQGLYIGEKLYHFSEFKAFGLIRDQGEHSIMLIPVKRFSPGVTVYFPEEAGEQIVDIFGARLPMQDLKLDAIDVVVRKLRL